jgi:hypothetical protein
MRRRHVQWRERCSALTPRGSGHRTQRQTTVTDCKMADHRPRRQNLAPHATTGDLLATHAKARGDSLAQTVDEFRCVTHVARRWSIGPLQYRSDEVTAAEHALVERRGSRDAGHGAYAERPRLVNMLPRIAMTLCIIKSARSALRPIPTHPHCVLQRRLRRIAHNGSLDAAVYFRSSVRTGINRCPTRSTAARDCSRMMYPSNGS